MGETVEEFLLSQEEMAIIVQKKLNSDKFTVSNYYLQPVGEWIGLCGDHAILNLEVTASGRDSKTVEKKLTFFVKLYPTVEFTKKFIEGTGSFRKEIFTYEIFDKIVNEGSKTLNECVAKCYLSKTNKFIILENLTDQGYASPSKHEFFDYDTVKVILEGLAKLHASSLVYEEKLSKKLDKNYRLIDEYEVQFEETYFNDKENFPNEEGLKAAFTGVLNSIKLFNLPEKLISGKDFPTVLEQELLKVFDLAKPSKDFRNTICHGDLWATNLVLKHNEENKPIRCKFVDFQCARYAPPAQDVMSVIYLTTSREFRHKFMYNLIGIYYSNLEKHVTIAGYDIKKIIPFENFLTSCDKMKVFALIQTAIYFPLILLRSDVVKEVFGDSETNKRALQEDRSLLVKDQMDHDENYKNRVLESLLDLKDYCDYL